MKSLCLLEHRPNTGVVLGPQSRRLRRRKSLPESFPKPRRRIRSALGKIIQQAKNHDGNKGYEDVEGDFSEPRRAPRLPVAQLGSVGHTYLIKVFKVPG